MSKIKGKGKAKIRKKKQLESKKKYESYKKNLISRIRTFNDPILLEKSFLVKKNENIPRIIKEIGKILAATKNGVGLAAPQIGYLDCIFAMRPDIEINEISFIINPEIIDFDKKIIKNNEACLSYPGILAGIERFRAVTISYFDENFKKYEKEFNGFRSIIVQHEMEHFEEGECLVGQFWRKKQNRLLKK